MNAKRKSLWIALLVCMTPTAAMAGSNWEMTSGLSTQREIHRGVTEIRKCVSPGGSLSVGTATPGGANPNSNLLIERLSSLAALGAPGFRYEYDTGQLPEQGAKVVEFSDGTGFAVVGSIDPPSTTALNSKFIVTKIDCDGKPLWRFSYGDVTDTNTAWDIIQTKSGNPAVGTQAGDLVALGKYVKPVAGGASITRPRIARTKSNGAPIWVMDYQTAIAGDFELQAIDELPAVAPSTTGDLVAVGRIGTIAAVIQVNGNTGAPVCAASLRGLSTAQYHDVVAVKTAAGSGEYLAVGETSGGTSGQQVYLSRFLPNCVLRVHAHWGATADREVGYGADLTLASTYAGVPAGVLMIGGEVNGTYNNVFSQDAFMHLANPQTLLPYVLTPGVSVIGKRYGTQGALSEKALTISAATKGAYFAGVTTTDWVPNGDPQQALTSRVSDGDFKTACSVDWNPPAITFALQSTAFQVSTIAKPAAQEALPARKPIDLQLPCCTIVP